MRTDDTLFGNGWRAGGEIGSSGDADGYGFSGIYALDKISEVQSEKS
jgi:hypothetical protein